VAPASPPAGLANQRGHSTRSPPRHQPGPRPGPSLPRRPGVPPRIPQSPAPAGHSSPAPPAGETAHPHGQQRPPALPRAQPTSPQSPGGYLRAGADQGSLRAVISIPSPAPRGTPSVNTAPADDLRRRRRAGYLFGARLESPLIFLLPGRAPAQAASSPAAALPRRRAACQHRARFGLTGPLVMPGGGGGAMVRTCL
jgi:hypothetical protein